MIAPRENFEQRRSARVHTGNLIAQRRVIQVA
jgi:hypothetical protein